MLIALCFDWSRGTVRPGSSRPTLAPLLVVFSPHTAVTAVSMEGSRRAKTRSDLGVGWGHLRSRVRVFLVSKRAICPCDLAQESRCACLTPTISPHGAVVPHNRRCPAAASPAVARSMGRRRSGCFRSIVFHCWTTSKNHNHLISPIGRSDTLVFSNKNWPELLE